MPNWNAIANTKEVGSGHTILVRLTAQYTGRKNDTRDHGNGGDASSLVVLLQRLFRAQIVLELSLFGVAGIDHPSRISSYLSRKIAHSSFYTHRAWL